MGCIETTHDIHTREHRKRKYAEFQRLRAFHPSSRPCKSGYLLFYTYGDRHGNMLKESPKWVRKWKKVFAILFEDSTLAWFNRPKQREPFRHIRLRDVCSQMLVGPACFNMPWNPESIPKKLSYEYMFAFPEKVISDCFPSNDRILYFLCPNAKSIGEWLTAIAGLLPPPPKEVRPLMCPPRKKKKGKVKYVEQNNESTTRANESQSSSGFWAENGIGFGYGKPWEWGWTWGLGDYHQIYGWGYEDFEIGKCVDNHNTALVEFDSESVASFGGSDFQDYGDLKVEETIAPISEDVTKNGDTTVMNVGGTNNEVLNGRGNDGMNLESGTTGNFRGIEELDFGLADYSEPDQNVGYTGGGVGGGGSTYDYGGGAPSGDSWGGGGVIDSGGGDSGGASCGGGGCGGGGCGGGGGGGDF